MDFNFTLDLVLVKPHFNTHCPRLQTELPTPLMHAVGTTAWMHLQGFLSRTLKLHLRFFPAAVPQPFFCKNLSFALVIAHYRWLQGKQFLDLTNARPSSGLVFFCVKNDNKNHWLDKLSQSFF